MASFKHQEQIKLPLPKNTGELNRWEYTRFIMRLINGQWKTDLQTHMGKHLGAARLEAWGPGMTSMNLYKSVINQMAVLYDQTPLFANLDIAEDDMAYMEDLDLFSKAQKHSRYVLGLRESMYRIHWSDKNQDRPVTLRLVTPDFVEIDTAYDTPVTIREYMKRADPLKEGMVRWFIDVWDISDPKNPTFKVIDPEDDTDVTSSFIDVDEEYPYVDENGDGFLPFVLYHAQDTGSTFNVYDYSELASGTLDIALLWSYWGHVVKDASWSQKYGLDVELNGLSSAGSGKASHQSIETDPSSILMFRSSGDGSGTLSSFNQSSDPKSVAASIISFSQVLIDNVGLSPTDFQKTVAQSGVAIRIKKEAVRRLQSLFEPQFRKSDIELLEKVALISNIFGDMSIKVKGWSIKYTNISKDIQELGEDLEYNKMLLENGLISEVDFMVSVNPGFTQEQAVAKILNNIEVENMISKARSTISIVDKEEPEEDKLDEESS